MSSHPKPSTIYSAHFQPQKPFISESKKTVKPWEPPKPKEEEDVES
jgi:hypothetical protein